MACLAAGDPVEMADMVDKVDMVDNDDNDDEVVGLGGIPLAYKIAIPFIGLLILTAAIAGPVARSWVASRIEQNAVQQLRDNRDAIDASAVELERQLLVYGRVASADRDLKEAVAGKSPLGLGSEGIGVMNGFGLSFYSIYGADSRLVYASDPSVFAGVGSELSQLMTRARQEGGSIGFLRGTKNWFVVGAYPITAGTKQGTLLVGLDIDRVIRRVKGMVRSGVVVCNPSEIFHSTFSTKITSAVHVKAVECAAVLQRGGTVFKQMDADGHHYRVAFFPFRIGGKSVGTLGLYSPADDVEAAKSTVTRDVIALNSLLVALMALFGYLIARNITTPLQKLVTATREISEGDLDERVEVTTADEVGDLAAAFNAMTESLGRRTEDLTMRVMELSALYDVSRIMGSTLDLHELLSVILNSTLRVFNADTGYVLLVNPETGKLQLEAWQLPPGTPQESRADVGESMAEWVAKEGKPLLFSPSLSDERFRKLIERTDTTSAICVPLHVQDKTIGVITVSLTRPGRSFTEDNVKLLSTIGGQAAISIQNARLFGRLQEAYLSTVRALAAAVDAKDPYTRGHSESVADYALMMADELGFGEQEKVALSTAAYLHDIGKIGISDEILHKPSGLSDQEMRIIRRHSLIATNILDPIPFPWKVTPLIRHHHEHWDGDGYPAGLKHEEIPLESRIMAIADAFDAMTSDRPYRGAMSPEDAIAEIKRCAGTYFDPKLVDVFVAGLSRQEMKKAPPVQEKPTEGQERNEIRAIFVTLAGTLAEQYDRLGGEKVAVRFGHELNQAFKEAKVPVTYEGGKVHVGLDGKISVGEELRLLRAALRCELQLMATGAGERIAQQFYGGALDALTARYRRLAGAYGFDTLDSQP